MRDAPTVLEGRVVVQTMGPELDDWLTFKIDEKTATVRFLRKLVARVLSARRSRCDYRLCAGVGGSDGQRGAGALAG